MKMKMDNFLDQHEPGPKNRAVGQHEDFKNVTALGIARHRIAQRMTQQELADKVGVKLKAIQNVERADDSVNLLLIMQIFNVLGLEMRTGWARSTK